MAYTWPSSNQREFDDNGILRAAKAYFFVSGTTTPLATYQDNALSAPHQHPVLTTGAKRWPAVYLPFDTLYKVRVVTSAGVVIYEQDGLSTPPESVDSGGVTVDDEYLWQTGDLKHRYGTGTHAGWVRCNGRSIGSASSGATERANADCEDLFEFLWNADVNLAVSGGRGGSAAADWAANKSITLPNMQGRALIGLEGMGGTAANVVQISTTISTTNASATVAVASAAGLAIGMKVLSANVPAGATITAISGTTIVLSDAATATASDTAARCSFMSDPSILGATGGSQTHILSLGELASHDHSGQTGAAGTHNHTVPATYAQMDPGPGAATSQYTASLNAGTGRPTSVAPDHQHSISSAGSDAPHANLSPAMTVTIYIKL